MSPEKMIMMCNQIATYFKSQPGNTADHVADHLRDFWEPRMRDQLKTYTSQGGEGLDSEVVRAVGLL